ncbi:MAG: DUF4112 domain-containing protein [Gammaproteobacteria bacterium]
MSDNRARLRRLERLAHWLDDSIPVPGTQWRIGVDSLLGLVPFAGDLLGGAFATYILYSGYRLGASWLTLLRMLVNVILELLVGAVPLLGDVFDMAFKANLRNVRLLVDHGQSAERVERHSFWWAVVVFGGMTCAVAGAMVLAIWITIVAIRALVGLL